MGKVEIWYRGEGAGVKPAAPGKFSHDFGDGFYLTNREDVANIYAGRRAPTPADRRVWMVALERSTLGQVLDLTMDSRWTSFMTGKDPMLLGQNRLYYLKIKHELYEQFFKDFLRLHKIDINLYDAVIGPEYNLGGNQLCILHKNGRPTKLGARIRALFRPVTAVARWTVSTLAGLPADVTVAPPPGTLKVRFAKVVGGSVVAIGITMLLAYLGSKVTEKAHEQIISDKIKSFQPEIEKTVTANKAFILHVLASGKSAYAVVTVIVEYWFTADEVGFSQPMQSIPGVKLDKVVIQTEKVEGPGKSYTRDPSHTLTIAYYPFTFYTELVVSPDDVEKYRAAMQEYNWYEEVLNNKDLMKVDIERLAKEKELLREMIQKSFY